LAHQLGAKVINVFYFNYLAVLRFGTKHQTEACRHRIVHVLYFRTFPTLCIGKLRRDL